LKALLDACPEIALSAPGRNACAVYVGADSSASAQKPAHGGMLILEPSGGKARLLRLVARDEFRLGRSATDSDFAARFPEHVPQALELAKYLGRVHARARLSTEGIILS